MAKLLAIKGSSPSEDTDPDSGSRRFPAIGKVTSGKALAVATPKDKPEVPSSTAATHLEQLDRASVQPSAVSVVAAAAVAQAGAVVASSAFF